MAEGNRSAIINEHQLRQIVSGLMKEYDAFGIQRNGKKITLERLEDAQKLLLTGAKTIVPFKKILWPNKAKFSDLPPKNKIAFLGLPNCDATALSILLKEFEGANLLPKRTDLFVMTAECTPDLSCFCTAFGPISYDHADLHLQKEGKDFVVFAFSKKGRQILEINGIKIRNSKSKLKEIVLAKEKINKKELAGIIDEKNQFLPFWEKVSKCCFGCGACSAVCPLCYCFKQEAVNLSDGATDQCINWDSCFSKSFSEIQHHFDFRPKNLDRLYNWYNHKFNRALSQKNHILCTGCGRCIEACPAHLNQSGIIESLQKQKEEEKNDKA